MSLPPVQLGRRTSAGLASVPGMRALSSLSGRAEGSSQCSVVEEVSQVVVPGSPFALVPTRDGVVSLLVTEVGAGWALA